MRILALISDRYLAGLDFSDKDQVGNLFQKIGEKRSDITKKRRIATFFQLFVSLLMSFRILGIEIDLSFVGQISGNITGKSLDFLIISAVLLSPYAAKLAVVDFIFIGILLNVSRKLERKDFVLLELFNSITFHSALNEIKKIETSAIFVNIILRMFIFLAKLSDFMIEVIPYILIIFLINFYDFTLFSNFERQIKFFLIFVSAVSILSPFLVRYVNYYRLYDRLFSEELI
jgi:hypothetical protein